MNFCVPPPLASIEAVRPVFMIVMGVFLLLIAWRLSRVTRGWTSRLIVSGAFLLALGYIILMPLYEARIIEPFSGRGRYHGDAATAMAWHTVKLITMNTGWLLLGLGIAMHAKIFASPSPARKTSPTPVASHDSVIA